MVKLDLFLKTYRTKYKTQTENDDMGKEIFKSKLQKMMHSAVNQ